MESENWNARAGQLNQPRGEPRSISRRAARGTLGRRRSLGFRKGGLACGKALARPVEIESPHRAHYVSVDCNIGERARYKIIENSTCDLADRSYRPLRARRRVTYRYCLSRSFSRLLFFPERGGILQSKCNHALLPPLRRRGNISSLDRRSLEFLPSFPATPRQIAMLVLILTNRRSFKGDLQAFTVCVTQYERRRSEGYFMVDNEIVRIRGFFSLGNLMCIDEIIQ